MPLTLRQVIESLISLKNSARVEDQISKAGGVQFEATPAVVDILKQFGAGPKLISMIPAPRTAPEPVAPKPAGPLTIVCEPADCAFAVDQKYFGATTQNRKEVTGLAPGEVTVEVFADGYNHATRKVRLEGAPKEERFELKRIAANGQQIAAASLVKALASLGGGDGLAELGDIEGSGTLQWTDSGGQVEQWPMTFNKRVGRDLAITFKTKDGQCTASILMGGAKEECRGGLRNGGEKIAEQATSLFLSYQPQDVVQALLKRPLIASETDADRLESADAKDAYLLTLGSDGLPSDLVYRVGNDMPIHVQYSNYINISKSRYPGKISIGRLNSAPVWVFNLSSVRSKLAR
jgi:hypothetical protein